MLEKIFGVVQDNELIEKALTHPSYTKELNLDDFMNYERLEFFGDSVLKLFTSKLLYNTYPNYPEGDLSKIRSILVSDAILSKIAFEIGIDKRIKLGPAEEKQGGRKRDSNLACSLEAILGAYYLNGKLVEIEEFISNYVMPYAKDIDEHFEKYNAKDLLQQYTQSIDKTLPIYRTVGVLGPAHKPIFEVEVEWQGKIIALGRGGSKKEAQQNCAYVACKSLGVIEEK
ncbi:MAG: ribonuclease III [Cyanobacteria bacterium SIG28]|nr:ribonuclease III [Cyanobacteria bacterium SIG28]